MSPKKNQNFILRSLPRLLVVFCVVAVVYVYENGGFNKTTFEFKPESGLFKEIRETGKITYKSGKVSTFENRYTAFEKRSFSNNILTLEGKTEGDFDPVLKPLIKGNTYLQKIDLSASYCPEDFVPHYPTALRNYVYFMPRTPLFDGKTWDIFSCGQSFLCSYSVSMKDHENKIDFGCSGKIGETHSTLVGSAVINGSFNGFSSIEMTIVSENNDLSSSWSFEEKNSFMPKISK